MLIKLPIFLQAKNYRTCLAIVHDILNTKELIVELDASELYRVDPFILSLLASAGSRYHRERNGVIKIKSLRNDLASYLDRMDLLKQLWISSENMPNNKRHIQSQSLVELKKLDHVNQVDGYANQIADAILGNVAGLDKTNFDEMTGYSDWEKTKDPLCYVFTELLNNALTHARRNKFSESSVWISAQYFRNSDQICIGIVDDGCGIYGSLETHPLLHPKTDYGAITLALQPRVSCNREVGLIDGTTNAGIGLTTSYRVAKESGGAMLIATGKAVMDVVSDNAIVEEDLPYWQGTILNLTLNRSNLMNLDLRVLMPAREIPREAPEIRFE